MTRPMFAVCDRCDARWQICTAPIAVTKLAVLTTHLMCPHCNSTKSDLGLCHTDGEHAVTEPRAPDAAMLAKIHARLETK